MKQKFTKHIENLKDEVLDELKTFIPMGTFVNFTNLCDYIDTCHWFKERYNQWIGSIYHSKRNEILFLLINDDEIKEIVEKGYEFKEGVSKNTWNKFIKDAEEFVPQEFDDNTLIDYWGSVQEKYAHNVPPLLKYWHSMGNDTVRIYNIPLEVLVDIRNFIVCGDEIKVGRKHVSYVKKTENRIIIEN